MSELRWIILCALLRLAWIMTGLIIVGNLAS